MVNILLDVVLFLLLIFLPNSIYAKFEFLPDQYWLVAVPTHFWVTLGFIFCLVKGWNYYLTDDNPVVEDVFYKKLSEKEMMKEIMFAHSEVPDTGDLDINIVNEVLK